MLDGHADRGVTAVRIARDVRLGDAELPENGGDVVAVAFVAHRRRAQRGAAMSFQVDANHPAALRERAYRLGHGADVHQAARHHDDRFALAVYLVIDAEAFGAVRIARGSRPQSFHIDHFRSLGGCRPRRQGSLREKGARSQQRCGKSKSLVCHGHTFPGRQLGTEQRDQP